MNQQSSMDRSAETAGDIAHPAPSQQPGTAVAPPISDDNVQADSGSDFYNTPWPVGTPVHLESQDVVMKDDGSERKDSHPTMQIPGLSLLNDGSKDLPASAAEPEQAQSNESGLSTHVGGEDTIATAKSEQSVAESQHPPPQDDIPANAQTRSVTTAAEETVNSVAETHTNGAPNTPAPGLTGAGTDAAENEEGHREWETDSSPYESSSDDSSTDSSDDDDENEEDYPILSAEEQARILMQAELGSDDEGEGKGRSGGHVRTANELPEEAPPIPEVTITPEMKIHPLGHVETIVENTVLIIGNVSGEYQVLESGSLLCLEDRSVVGVVSDTLGRVEQPFYAVRYPNAAEIENRGLAKGKPIFYVESHSTFVFTQPLKGMKGSDASNFHDEEIGEDEIEFSDDEAEAEYKRRLKQKRQERRETRSDSNGHARARKGPPGPSTLSQSELNYDDEGEAEGYTPLARPKNLHELMGHQEAPMEPNEQFSRSGGFRGGRGRGRSRDRGRGGRGRGGRGSWEPRDQHERQTPYHRQEGANSHHHQTTAAEPRADAPHYNNVQPYQTPQQGYFGMPTQFGPGMAAQQQPMAQGTTATQFPFQMPYQQPYQQALPTPYLNPAFFAALQQQQQQQQHYAPQQGSSSQHPQGSGATFDQVQAQLEFLRQLSHGNQGQRPS